MPSFHEEVLARLDAGQGLGSIEAHLDACPPCRRELAARARNPVDVRPIPHELAETAKRMAVPVVRRKRTPVRVWAAAAAIGAVAVAMVLLEPRGEAPVDVLRRGTDQTAAIELRSPAEGAVVSRSRIALSWTPVAGARRYTVRILDARGAILRELTTERPSLEIRDLDLSAGSLGYWYVIASMDDGRVVESRPQSVRIE